MSRRPEKQIVHMRVLPGEPLDGTGSVCVHLFVKDERGSFVEPCVIHPKLDAQGNQVDRELVHRPTRGRLACDRKRQVAPRVVGDEVVVTPRSDDPRAVNCPGCVASKEYRELMGLIAQAEAAR